MADESDDPRRIDDLDRSQAVESAGLQNSVAVAGPAALLMVPLARLLSTVGQALRRRTRRSA